jgi:hypothetical protein
MMVLPCFCNTRRTGPSTSSAALGAANTSTVGSTIGASMIARKTSSPA